MIHEVGSWQHFVKRQDNIGLPIMEVKQKYLKEMNSSPIDLTGGGSRRVTSTPAPTVYTFVSTLCCGNGNITVYSSSPVIQVGVYLYTNIGLTIPFYNDTYYLVEGIFDCIQQTYNGIFTNPSGLVIQTDHSNNCGD
jgi:hypothetical protein